MCRIAGYLGAPVALSEVLSVLPRSLREQAKAPRDLPPGAVGSDGFGVGWFVDGRIEPARYRHTLPIWADENVDAMGSHIVSAAFLASARTATREMPVSLTNTPPFLAGRTLLVHNGSIDAFHHGAMDRLRAELRPETRAQIFGNSDSEHVAAILADADPARELVGRTRTMLEKVDACLRSAGVSAKLTLLIAEPAVLVAVRHGVESDAPALHWRSRDGGTMIASEPMDDGPEWQELTLGSLLVVRRNGASVERL